MEGARAGVGLGEDAIDGGVKLNDRSEHAAFELPFGQHGEVTFDGIEP
jgi:hypothetical protein